MAYTNPYPPPLIEFLSFQSMGAHVPLSYDSDSGVARICQQGAKATKRGRGFFPLPRLGDFLFCFVVENSCMKTAFSCT